MLTKQSHVAINHFLPLIHKMTGNLKLLYDHLDQFEPSFYKVSDQITQKKITLGSLDSERFIDEHLKKDITKLTQCRNIIFKTGQTTFTLEVHYTYENLDITNQKMVNEIINKYQPNVIINTAAITNVDLCEYKKNLCDLVNTTRPNSRTFYVNSNKIFIGKLFCQSNSIFALTTAKLQNNRIRILKKI